MIDKIWWHFEDFVDFVAKLIKRSKSNDPTKGNPADQGVAITRDGKVYVGKDFQGEPLLNKRKETVNGNTSNASDLGNGERAVEKR